MSDLTNERKIQHIHIVNEQEHIDRRKYYFDLIKLKHRALPETDLNSIDPSITFMGKKLSFPLLISSMTGGDHQLVREINRNCAIAAQETGIAMAVGSQRVMFTTPAAVESFRLRQYAPTIPLIANLGAVQLNYGFDYRHCEQAVEVVGADALYFHLNPLQEAVQPEGDTNFKGLAAKIARITAALSKPVIVKEVGAGISDDDAELLIEGGVRYVDVAGSGGTSWSYIEHYRNDDNHDLGELFRDWGIPTPLALQMLAKYRDRLRLIASGGIRNGIDMAKSIILGASLCGMAKPFLQPAMESPQAVIKVINQLKLEFVTTMFLLGIDKVQTLFGNQSLILNEQNIVNEGHV